MPDMDEYLSGIEQGQEEPQGQEVAPETPTGEQGAVVVEADGTPPADTGTPPAPEEVAKPDPVKELERRLQGVSAEARAERQKRQAYEAEVLRLQQEAQRIKPDIFEDPEQWQAMQDARIAEVEAKLRAENQRQLLNLSDYHARKRYPDYLDRLEVFGHMSHENPALWDDMLQQPDPAEFAYQTAKRYQTMQEFGDPDKFAEKVKVETEAKLRAEYEAKLQEELKKRTALPGTLSDVGGGAVRTAQAPTTTPLSEIFGKR